MKQMKKSTVLSLCAVLSAVMVSVPAAHSAQTSSAGGSVVLVNGRFYTPQGWKQAVSVKDGRIVAVGTESEVSAKAGGDVRRIDLGGRTVFPGLHDLHVHPLTGGLAMKECRFPQGSSRQQILDRVAECVKSKKPGEWITGGQWQGMSFGDTPPHRSMLDKVAPNNPVVLVDISMHNRWANSRALQLAKITRDTPDPKGGIIERDAQGEPTGVLRESAAGMVLDAIPVPSVQQRADALKDAFDVLLSFGITSVVDASMGADTIEAYHLLADEGKLVTQVRGCLGYGNAWGSNTKFDALLAERARLGRPTFKLDCVKVMTDGVPTESHTAAMLEPYADTQAHGHGASPSELPPRGMLLVPPQELNPLVTRLDKQGITVKFHAAGDWSARAALDAIEAARKANGPNGPTHDVSHLPFVTRADLARAKGLRATLEFSPYLWFPTVINQDIIKAIGPQRIERVWPVREGIESGALVVVGSDWPGGTPTNNPWIGMETLLTRRVPGDSGNGESFGPKEAIDLKQAVDMFTINGARQMGDAQQRGSIEAHKIADLIVLDRNPFEIPVTEIHEVTVEQVFVNGSLVYQKRDAASSGNR